MTAESRKLGGSFIDLLITLSRAFNERLNFERALLGVHKKVVSDPFAVAP